MPQGKTGVTVGSAGRRLLGDGAVYMDYDGVRTLLGATRGGGTFDPGRELSASEIDGVLGDVKGFVGRDRVTPTLKVTLVELTVENFLRAIAGADSTPGTARVHVSAEYVGVGTGGQTIYPLDNANVLSGTLELYGDVGAGPVLLSEGAAADYTVVYATGVVTFNAAPPAATAGTSRSGLNPVIDMTAHAADINGIVAVDGGAPTAIVYDWTGCTTGALTATQIQTAIQALVGDFATVTCAYVGAPPNDYYLITSGSTGLASQFVCSDGAPNNAHDHLELGIANGGTELLGEAAMDLTADYSYDAGGVVTHDVITGGPIEDADFLTDVAWVGTFRDSAEDGVIIVKNVLCRDLGALTFGGKEVGLEVTFQGHFDEATPQTEPWEIRRPRP